MSNTSQKHRNFVSEPMSRKPVRALAGVGNTLGTRLEHQGYQKATQVYGQYLVMGENKQQFQGWMKDACGANSKQSTDTYQCLREYNREFN